MLCFVLTNIYYNHKMDILLYHLIYGKSSENRSLLIRVIRTQHNLHFKKNP
jgi:hypothetical protein